MSAETRPTGKEIDEISRKIKLMSQLEELEHSGIHVDELAKTIDPTKVGIFAEEVHHIHEEKLSEELKIEPTFAQRFRIFTRRQSRRTTGTLVNRPSHHSRKRR